MIVKDSMVLIHLAKLTLLQTSCNYFKSVTIPQAVHKEALKGKNRGYADAVLIEELIDRGCIKIEDVKDAKLLRRAREFSIQGGEAEALALYWQKKAKLLATDDDSVRKKRAVLDIRVIGTPAIIVGLYDANRVDRNKVEQSAKELRRIGWFSSSVIDKMLMRVESK
jgi:predicted nucleic acid-binding protein